MAVRVFKGLTEPKRFALESAAHNGGYGPPMTSVIVLNSRSGIPNGFQVEEREIPELDRRLAAYSESVVKEGHREMARSSEALRKAISR